MRGGIWQALGVVAKALILSTGAAMADERCVEVGVATGGAVSALTVDGELYCVHQFTSVGDADSFNLLRARDAVEYLFIGGGGGGGSGGGGAGGFFAGSFSNPTPQNYSISVGNGGLPRSGGTRGDAGGSSTAFGITAGGGGGGGSSSALGGGSLSGGDGMSPGGSGGGAAAILGSASGGAGSAPGNNGAGSPFSLLFAQGGGGGGAGANASGRSGGAGLQSAIAGLQFYAGGGRASGGSSGAGQNNAGGGGNESQQGQNGIVILRYIANFAPTANAGGPQTVTAFTPVTLDGSGSTDPEDNIETYVWTQLSGTNVVLSGADTETPSFTAPQPTGSSETLSFRLTVTDAFGLTDSSDVEITVTALPGQLALGTGGTVNEFNDPDGTRTWRVHSFSGSGTLNLPEEPTDVEYLIVGGGGGGGAAAGGGGGAGGMRTGIATSVSGEQAITVGTGGAGGFGSFPDSPQQSRGSNGGNSAAFGVVALGGGGGGTYFSNTPPEAKAGLAGGSGGGASHDNPGGAGSDGQGNNGATGAIGCGASSGGGGGGAGQPGFVGTSSQGGRGGDGAASTITGSPVFYAGGGAGGGDDRDGGCGYSGNPGVIPNEGGLGGGGASTFTNGQPGTNGLGGGGGGAQLNTTAYTGGSGGSGIVVVRYVINTAPIADAGGNANAFAGQEFTLDGSDSDDLENNIISYSWAQLEGTPVLPAETDTAQISFTPSQPANGDPSEALVFELTVTDAFGLTSTDQVTITLNAVAVLSASKDVSVFAEVITGCDDPEATPPDEPANPAAIPGACIQYAITVTNDGPVAASAITLIDELPAHLSFQAAYLGGDWGEGTVLATPNCPGSACEIRVEGGVLDAGETATVLIRATIN